MATTAKKFEFNGREKAKIFFGIIFLPWLLFQSITYNIKKREEKKTQENQGKIAQKLADNVVKKNHQTDFLKTLLFKGPKPTDEEVILLKNLNKAIQEEEDAPKPTKRQSFLMHLINKKPPQKESEKILQQAYNNKKDTIEKAKLFTKEEKKELLGELKNLFKLVKDNYGRKLIDEAKKYYRELFNANTQLRLLGNRLKRTRKSDDEPVYLVIHNREHRIPVQYTKNGPELRDSGLKIVSQAWKRPRLR